MPNKSLHKPITVAKKPHLYLQVGAFGSYHNAKKLESRLHQFTKKPILITKKDTGVIVIYRVRIGPLVGVGESDTLFNKLQKHGLKTAMTVII